MKKIPIILLILHSLLIYPYPSLTAQSFELQQLILNIQKLNQLKTTLNQLYKGYQVVSTGYNTIKDLSQGNFSLHKTFLDGLLTVSPVVKKYKRFINIIQIQQQLIQQYRQSSIDFKTSQVFKPEELQYIEKVYAGLIDRSVKNLDELLMIVTSGQLRMNDAERLTAIDRIYDQMKNKLDFLHYFNSKTSLLGLQRKKAIQEFESIEQTIKP